MYIPFVGRTATPTNSRTESCQNAIFLCTGSSSH